MLCKITPNPVKMQDTIELKVVGLVKPCVVINNKTTDPPHCHCNATTLHTKLTVTSNTELTPLKESVQVSCTSCGGSVVKVLSQIC